MSLNSTIALSPSCHLIQPNFHRFFYPHTELDNSNFARSTSQNTSNHRMQSNVRNSCTFDEPQMNILGSLPTSPKISNVVELSQDFGPLPISPHVNVPNSLNNIRVPPPLPPRRRERHVNDRDQRSAAQSQQAPDAPELPPRDISPPPVPPRIFTKPFRGETILREHNLQPMNLQPLNTSMLILRRNSALRESASSGELSVGSASTSTNVTAVTTPTSGMMPPPLQPIVLSDGHQDPTKKQNVAPPINRKQR